MTTNSTTPNLRNLTDDQLRIYHAEAATAGDTKEAKRIERECTRRGIGTGW